VTAVELDEGRRLGESFVKQLTGGETLTARFLYSEHFEFAPAFKLWLGTNHKPTIRGTDHAIWRRVRLIPFAVTIPEGERDRRLGEKLRAEWPGILRWALDGCRAWQRDGLGEPEEVRAATAEYRAEQDTVGQFIADTCVIEADAAEPVDTIYTVYEAWCDDAGVRFRLTKQQLGDKLTERDGIQRGRLGKQRTRVFLGIRRRRSDDLVQGESRDGADAADAADSSSANLSYRVPTRKETGNARPLLSAVRRKRP
jgi:putative DNA primase/helicase